MPKKKKKEIEKYYFERFSKDYQLTMVNINYGDKPDVVIIGDRKIGIEITNFFLEDGRLPESEQIQRKTREDVVNKAQQIYQARNKRKIEFSFGFNKDQPIRDKKKVIQEIVELAIRVDAETTGEINRDEFRNIPEVSFVYLNARSYDDAKWRVIQIHTVHLMSRRQLVDIVRKKERKSKEYERCDAYWLLVVVNFIDPAQDQEIRIDNAEKIKSNVFEKILVYKTVFGHVFEAK